MASENENGTTGAVKTKAGSRNGSSPRAYAGRNLAGVTCLSCGEELTRDFPNRTGSVMTCSRCNPGLKTYIVLGKISSNI